ncbi:MAG: hypothetical protein LPK88_02070 [Alphaproteobacteria bacterium]|nr:hypothetical protein [Alphaproteobacteria bacterium]MDX5415094.1 hypothetical protein [Alphaproteobacteria bacterium]MDX5492285.1 hypothetical protein [Alphaproteobacteria bacterium]
MSTKSGVRPLVLALLDGWGIRGEREGNAIALARTPIYDRLAATWPRTELAASGEALGLLPGQPGHMQAAYAALGAGRAVEPATARIGRTFSESGAGGIANHPVLREIISRVRPLGGAVHLIGMVTPSRIAGYQHYMAVLAALLSHEGVKVWVHAVMDGQDAAAQGGIGHLQEFLDDISGAGNAELGSVFGRSHGFDEGGDPSALAAAWRAISQADAPYTEYPTAYLDECYRKGLDDDRVPPRLGSAYRGIRQDDAVLLVNLQPDHGHALVSALTDPASAGLPGSPPPLAGVYTLVRLANPLPVEARPLFEATSFRPSLAGVFAEAGLHQLALSESIAETAMSNMLRGGAGSLFPGETILVTDTPPASQIERKPELAAATLTNELLDALKKGEHDVMTVGFANAAILGRTGNLKATVNAVEAIDKCLGKIAAQIDKKGGMLVLCGTYGKAERMIDPDNGMPFRRTTAAPVPFVLIGGDRNAQLARGTLADVAPTLLGLAGIETPAQMSGQSLLLSADQRDAVGA